MKEQLNLLIRLQETDTRINNLEKKKTNIPELLKAMEKPVEIAREQLNLSKNKIAIINKEKKEKEIELETQEEKIKKQKNRSSDIKTNKEYEAHLFEIETANKKKTEIEDEMLIILENFEILSREIKEKEEFLKKEEGRISSEKKKYNIDSEEIDEELNKLVLEHKEIEDKIESAHLRKYKQIKDTKKEVVVATVINGTCTGCNMNIPPQLVAEVKKSEKILTCTYCNRILSNNLQ